MSGEGPDAYGPALLPVPTDASDITRPHLPGEHLTILGFRSSSATVDESETDNDIGGGADATFDELAAYDFGTPPSAGATTAPAELAASRYASGRYSRGWRYWAPGSGPIADAAGAWISGPISLGEEALAAVGWTYHESPSTPGDYPEVELLDVGGAAYLGSGGTSRSSQVPSSRAASCWTLPGPVSGPFRLRVLFRRDAAVPVSTPVLDSPVLDEVTLYPVPGIRGWDRG